MDKGTKIYFVDVERQYRSVTSVRLPLSIYTGVVNGIGSSLVSVYTRFGTICFDKSTKLSQAKDYKMFEDVKLARRIITERRKRKEARG